MCVKSLHTERGTEIKSYIPGGRGGVCGSEVPHVSSGLSQSVERGRCRVNRRSLTYAGTQL